MSSRKRPREEDSVPQHETTPAKAVKHHQIPADSGNDGLNTPQNAPEIIQKCLVFIVEKKMSLGHLTHLRGVARKKGFPLASSISDEVTHIVSTLPSYDRTIATLPSHVPASAEVVNLEWLTTSYMEGKPVQVTDRYRLKKITATPERLEKLQAELKRNCDSPYQPPDYECQRPTLLRHHNHVLTDALELLERNYQYLDYKQGDTRALAFRQASCALKVFPKKVECIDEVANLHRIGRHSRQIIQDILSSGDSREVQECKDSEWFQCMELFTAVYGCGPATAEKWFQKGLRTIEDVRQCKELELTEIQRLGLMYYEHLSVPVSHDETKYITAYIQSQAEICFPGTSVEAVGGFRRGKPHGHDVDLLLTHSDTTITDVLLTTLVDHLHKQGVVIDCDATMGHNTMAFVQHAHVNTSKHNFTPTGKQRRVKFDHLDKAFCILKLDSSGTNHEEEEKARGSQQTETSLIRRVDLIVSPPEQYPFALVSWTGSKQFNRSLRRYSAKECNMSVTARGIYDMTQGKFIQAKTEQDVFSILRLKYLEPWERNC